MAYLNQGGLDYFWEKVKEYANSTITVSPKEVSGSIATFDDGSETPVKSLSVNIDPVQAGSGDPSPENVRPISGWDGVNVTVAGKNLFSLGRNISETTISGVTLKPNEDGSLTLNGTATAGTNFNLTWGNFGYPLVGLPYAESNYTVTFSLQEVAGVSYVGIGYIDKDLGSHQFGSIRSGAKYTATMPKDALYLRVYVHIDSGTTLTNAVVKIQAEYGSTATEWVPSVGTVYPISIPQTVYGGVLDVKNGTLTVTKKMVDLGTLTWSVFSNADNNFRYRTDNLTDRLIGDDVNGTQMSNLLASTTGNFTSGQSAVITSKSNSVSLPTTTTKIWVYMPILEEDSVSALTAWFTANPTYLVYDLATPLTLSLTPAEVRTILGYNNIYADSGNVDVMYYPQAAQKPTIEGVKTSTISVPNGTEADLLDETIAVKAGHSYAISYAAQFAANSTGYRRTKVYIDGADAGVIAADIQAAVSGAETVCRGEHWFAASSDGEVMIKGLQNSGGALSASTSIRVIDLGN